MMGHIAAMVNRAGAINCTQQGACVEEMADSVAFQGFDEVDSVLGGRKR